MPRDFSSGAWARQPNHAREADRGRCLRRSVSVSATRKATHAARLFRYRRGGWHWRATLAIVPPRRGALGGPGYPTRRPTTGDRHSPAP
jgi:hypothetical protein